MRPSVKAAFASNDLLVVSLSKKRTNARAMQIREKRSTDQQSIEDPK
jgi:hypothetical protein